MQSVLKVDWESAYIMMSIALAITSPLFVFFGWLSDRIGRKRIKLTGVTLGALTYLPIYMVYAGLAYPIALCLMTLVIGGLLIRETKGHKIDTNLHVAR